LNHCINPNIPLSNQPAQLIELSQLAEVIPSSFDCGARYTPTTQLIDFDEDGTDELVLHTQAIRCDIYARFGFLGGGGLSVVYRLNHQQQAWIGTLIWPCLQEECPWTRAWTQSPQPIVQRLPVHDSQNRSFMLVAGGYIGGDHTGIYLNIWRWEKEDSPQIVRQIHLMDWCGVPNQWKVTDEGQIRIPKASATNRCPSRDAVMYVLQDDEFEAVKP